MIKFSRVLILLTFFYGLHGCSKKEDCITILEKRTFNSRYYFLFENDVFSNNTNNNMQEYSPDKYSSGEVNFEVFQKFKVGDEYCNF
mgnify:CR=1 FL=1